MNLASPTNVFSLALLGAAGVVGSAAITAKLVDGDAGMKVLILGTVCLVTALIALVLLYRHSTKRVIAYLWFVAVGVNVGGTFMLFGLCIPIFVLHPPSSGIGATLTGYFLLALFYQLHRAYRMFVQAWDARHEVALAKFYDKAASSICIEPFMRALKIDATLFLPKRLEPLSGVLSLGLILSMVVGLNLRHTFPKFSVFAFGIPALTMTTQILQMAFLRVLLASELGVVQTGSGSIIMPVHESGQPGVRKKPRCREH